ncbi:hypothetical protein [Marinigracilibium pacificum]|uniref:Uncharacterized protein n=1 Tax=Marinigracilibium pacificum TaxID=2729599 RepID=A0A848JAQ7_9BACT|nr:hypothetical protein [Marinigracilibium pacificum]NMM50122.1 hypothetical protein [Marinigracilibium pacificum]
MKVSHLTTPTIFKSRIDLKCCLLVIFLILTGGCTNEPDEFVPTGKMKVDGFVCCDGDKELNQQLLKEINEVKASVAQLQNYNIATYMGWDNDLTDYVPNMGHHFAKMSEIDGEFNHRVPEVLLFIPGQNGKWSFVGVEYLVPTALSPDPPEGFTGDLDKWVVVGPFWALHLWIKVENPDGIFHPTNSRIP